MSAVAERLLIIDDDQRLADMVVQYLSARGLAVEHRADASSGLALLGRGGFDALILDVMLPDADGFEVCKKVRAGSDIPILMLTARGEAADRIVGLEIGADDYLPKPFDPRELLARLKAILRRRAPAPKGSPLRFGRLVIDREAREARVGETRCDLTSHQFALLVALAERAGRVQSREQLMEAVRGEELEAFDRSIDVHISRIRAAIEDDPKSPRLIRTVRGVGYVMTRPGDE
jgi:two-component system, OmpR family, phosphate regulon response regulator OmpR